MRSYTGYGSRSTTTPQTEPIPGSNQVQNNAGGYSFAVDDMTRLQRLLILGAAGGTYYVGERKLVRENLDALERLLKAGRGKEVIDLIVKISDEGRAPSNDPALFALARCCACDVHGKVSYLRPERTHELHRHHHLDLFEQFPDEEKIQPLWDGTALRRGDTIFLTIPKAEKPVLIDHPDDVAVRQSAYSVLHKVARIGTHWLHFQEYEKQFRGRGRAHRRAAQAWYQEKPVEKLAYQVVKYQQRDGWTQRDVLRLARPKPQSKQKDELYHWITKGTFRPEEMEALKALELEHGLQLILAFEQVKQATDEKEVAALIKEYRLPREAIPTQFLNSIRVWEALMEDMPLEAMTRNLATMTKIGVLVPMGDFTQAVVTRLHSQEAIHKARLHPIKLLAALMTYQSGKSVRGDATWTPIPQIVDALNDAFYLSFQCVEPSNKRILLALDVSGSMSSGMVGNIPGLTPRVAAAAMALVTAKVEPHYHIMAFSRGFVPISISPSQRLDDALRATNGLPFDGTDCSLPILWAMKHNAQVDTFVVYTDSETWAGNIQPVQALQRYRQQFNIPARLVVVGMVSNGFTIADPNDAGMLDCVGFDTATPEIISSFTRGEI